MRRLPAPISHLIPVLVLAGLALLAAIGAPARGQSLDLDPVPAMPALRGESVTRSVSDVLKDEIQQLESAPAESSDPLSVAIRKARIEFRRFAFDLLARATGGQATVDQLAMHGFRLADARRRVDLRLERVLEGSGTRQDGSPRPLSVREKDRVGRLLLRFAEVAPKALGNATLTDARQLDASVGVALEPLVDAIAILEERPTGDELGSGWPTSEELGAVGATTSLAPRSATIDDPCDEASYATLGPATTAALRTLCASEGRDDARAIDRAHAAMRLSAAATAATWLDANERAALDQSGAALVEDRGAIRLIAAQTAVVEARSRLLASEGAKHEEHKELDDAVRRALFPSAERGVALIASPVELARIVRRIAESIDLGARARSAERAEAPKEFRTAQRDAEKRYRKTEAATWTKLVAMLADEEAVTNPEQTSIVREQRESLRDLDRVSGVQTIIDSVGGVRPQAARGLAARLRTVIRWLGEPTRRADAIATYDTLALHVAMFLPLPYERELRAASDEALGFTAGKADQLIDLIDIARAEWADAWATGDATGPAAQRMVAIHRLMRAMEDLSQGASPESRDAVAALSRWGAFHATRAALAPAMVDVRAMTQLATAAAVARDGNRLERELARIERDAPLARLVGRLSHDLGPWLDTRPGDVLGQLVAIRTPPAEGAWGLALRPRIAAILRTARELDFARRSGRAEDEQVLVEHLSKLARRTLESLGAERSALPDLPPLDESDAREPRERKR
jgi:hypothetical protein